jgi:hypothetical protein
MLTVEDRATRLQIINATMLAEVMDGSMKADQCPELQTAEASLAKTFKRTPERVRQIVEAALRNDPVLTDDQRINYEVLLLDIAVRLRDDNAEDESCMNCVRKAAVGMLDDVRHDGIDEATTVAASVAGALYGLSAEQALEVYDHGFDGPGPGCPDDERLAEIVRQFEFEVEQVA